MCSLFLLVELTSLLTLTCVFVSHRVTFSMKVKSNKWFLNLKNKRLILFKSYIGMRPKNNTARKSEKQNTHTNTPLSKHHDGSFYLYFNQKIFHQFFFQVYKLPGNNTKTDFSAKLILKIRRFHCNAALYCSEKRKRCLKPIVLIKLAPVVWEKKDST